LFSFAVAERTRKENPALDNGVDKRGEREKAKDEEERKENGERKRGMIGLAHTHVPLS
jgi:hypothetical protein